MSRKRRIGIGVGFAAVLVAAAVLVVQPPNEELRAVQHFEERGANVFFKVQTSQVVQDVLGRWSFGRRLLDQTRRVRAIHLNHATFTETDVEHLRNCPKLEVLGLTECRVGDDLIRVLPQFPRLIHLHLSGLTDDDLDTIATLTGLQRLSIEGKGVTNSGLARISELPQLEELYLRNADVTDAGLVHLNASSNLRNLDLWYTQVTEAGVESLREKLPSADVRRNQGR